MTKLQLSKLETCLLAFETACPRPTTEQIEAWCKQFPEFADSIREHAQFVEPPTARGKDALALLTEAEKDAARAQAFKIMGDASALAKQRKKQQYK